MKKNIILTIFLGLVLPIFIMANGNHSLSAEDVLGGIMSSQNADEAASINCQEVTDEQFEELGEAAMGLIHPDEQQHKFMDQMMGGEGSEGLRSAHITMGQNYLGCDGGAMGGGMMGGMDMMSMMGNWSNDNSITNMMGGWWGWFGWTFMILFWVFLIVGIIALIKWIIKK